MTEDYVVIPTEKAFFDRQEILMKNAGVTLPTEGVPIGSVAYTADGSYIAIFDGEQWTQWGGGADA